MTTRPIHPFKGQSTVAEFSSAPGTKYRHGTKPTKAWRTEQRKLKSKYVADVKAYHLAMKQWSEEQKNASSTL